MALKKSSQYIPERSFSSKLFSAGIGFFICFIFFINLWVFVTNPFHSLNIIQQPFSTTIKNNQIVLHQNYSLHVVTNPILRAFAYYKSAAHIIANVYLGSPKTLSLTESGIIAEIHQLRFNPSFPYLISGDHFVVFYPRNLGIFYASTLDSSTALNKNDWENRQRIFLQSTAYALDTFSKLHNTTTTIVPIGSTEVVPINIFTYPSDSLYGVLYALSQLQQSGSDVYPLKTQEAAKKLLLSYHKNLEELLLVYRKTVYDQKTGLIKKSIHLSSARDAAIRQSSFYDNVIYWKTLSLASNLGIISIPQDDLDRLKQRIIQAFWYEKGGYFIDDLSSDSLSAHSYSSDWLIGVSTGFFDLSNQMDQQYVTRAITYIQENKIDKPFGLKYQSATDRSKEFFFVRYFVPSYGEDAIWSHWGMEYIKTLELLYQATQNSAYKRAAKENLDAYDRNIVEYRGYPEVYTSSGKFLENIFYKSIRQTGWVVNFEEAKNMYESLH
ncbi:MAG TPA: hypothetical protein VFQ63_01670 [Patescibacteria group bacterium]|nr:hypothetical protein [Patescibacteria group bacterium]